MSSSFWASPARHSIVCFGFKLFLSVLLVFALLQAVFWTLADIHYREFQTTFQQLVAPVPGTPEFNVLALKASNQIRQSIKLAPTNSLYRRALGNFDSHLQSINFNPVELPQLKSDPESAFIAAAQRSPTWETPYLDLAQLFSQQTSISFEKYVQKCQPLFKAATDLNPTYAYAHEQWASSLAMILGHLKEPSPKDISRVCQEFGLGLTFRGSKALWDRAFVICSELTREYRFLSLLKPSTATEWSDLAAALAQDNVELWHQAKDDFLADLEGKKHPLHTYLAIAVTLAKFGFTREGEWILSRYVTLNPHDADAWKSMINLAETYGLGAQKKEIEQMVTQALASADYKASAWVYFARILFEYGDNESSSKVFRYVLARNPLTSYAYLELGDILAKADSLQGAGLAYQKSVHLEPNNMTAWVRLGLNLAKQGNYQLAVQKLEEALSINPNNPQVKKALRGIGVY